MSGVGHGLEQVSQSIRLPPAPLNIQIINNKSLMVCVAYMCVISKEKRYFVFNVSYARSRQHVHGKKSERTRSTVRVSLKSNLLKQIVNFPVQASACVLPSLDNGKDFFFLIPITKQTSLAYSSVSVFRTSLRNALCFPPEQAILVSYC